MQSPPTTAQESKKRPFEGGDEGGSKRANIGDGADDLALKCLVTNGDAGAVIGKGGSVISVIQQESGARVKMSQNNDFYPGTQDRVLLITGTKDSVFAALSKVSTLLHLEL